MRVPLLNFEGGPGVLLLNFDGGPGVPFLNFEGGHGSHFYTMPFRRTFAAPTFIKKEIFVTFYNY